MIALPTRQPTAARINTFRPVATPNEQAQRLTGRPYLSWSSLSTFRQCPLRWRFKYVDGLREESVGANLVFGAAIHAALQAHFESLLAGGPPPELEDLLGAYRTSWADRPEERVLFGKEDIDALEELAERMLRAFQLHPLASGRGTILGVEEELVGPVVPDGPDLLARLDLVAETAGETVVTDFKTSRSRWGFGDERSHAEQLLLYGELVRLRLPDKPVRLQFMVLTKAKTPAVDLIPLAVDEGQVERTKTLVAQLWAAMRAGIAYPNPSPLNCPTCPYQRQCRAWGG